jgi:NitT/TauT family transport system substrate-binding protein
MSQIASEKKPVTLVLQWHHQAQFAGYYMALAKQFYAGEGLDVRILRGGPDVRGIEMLDNGTADFITTMLPTAIEAHGEGVRLVNLAQIVNRSNFVLAARRNPLNGDPIDSISDLEGRPVTIWVNDFRTPYLALFNSMGIRPVLLPQYYTLSLFKRDGAVACSAMRYNEQHTLFQSGIKPSDLIIFDLHEMGITMLEDGIYAMSDTCRKEPDLCAGFVRASLAGWRYAKAHEEETLDVVMEYAWRDNLPVNRVHMRWMLRKCFHPYSRRRKTTGFSGISPGKHLNRQYI